MRKIVKFSQKGAFHHHSNQTDDQRREDHSNPKVTRVDLDPCISAVSAQHIESAVRKVDDPEHPEDNGQAKGQQNIKRPKGEAVK